MTLGKITVQNFQSIDKGEVELGSFTVFTGPTSSGKSAFLRASQAVIRNNFTPAQVRQGEKFSEVTVEVDGHTVTAIRGKSQSTYKVDGEEYTKAGRSVPEAAALVFSMPEIAEMESSFSFQYDKPYLIAEPGAVAAKVLGSLTNVSMLHKGLKEANRRALELRSRLKIKTADLEELDTNLENYQTLDSDLQKLDALITAEAEYSSTESKARSLQGMIDKTDACVVEFKRTQSAKVDLSQVEGSASELDSLLYTELEPLSELVQRIEGAGSSLPSWDYTKVPQELLEDYASLSRLYSTVCEVEARVESFKDAARNLEIYRTKEQETQDRYDNLIKDLEVCPLCNSTIGDCID